MIIGGLMDIPRHKIALAALSFIVGMVVLYFAGGYVQYHFGVPGLVMSEMMILVVAVLSVLVSRLDFKQVFRVRSSSLRVWMSSLLIYLSVLFGAAAVTYLYVLVSPSLLDTSSEISGFILSDSFFLAVIAVAILPGICEEAWHRGYILTSLGSIKSIAVRVVILGLVFGLFHMDATRFFQTMILGMGLSFMRIKTDNFLIPVAFHSLNNLFSVVLTFASSSMSQGIGDEAYQAALEGSVQTLSSAMLLPIIFFTLALSVLFLTLGLHSFKKVDALKQTPLAPLPLDSPQPLWPPPSSATSFWPQPTPSQSSWPPPSVDQAYRTWPLQSPSALTAQTPETSVSQRRRTVIIVSICGAVALLSCFSCFVLALMSAV